MKASSSADRSWLRASGLRYILLLSCKRHNFFFSQKNIPPEVFFSLPQLVFFSVNFVELASAERAARNVLAAVPAFRVLDFAGRSGLSAQAINYRQVIGYW
jgi:hypothetical protein